MEGPRILFGISTEDRASRKNSEHRQPWARRAPDFFSLYTTWELVFGLESPVKQVIFLSDPGKP